VWHAAIQIPVWVGGVGAVRMYATHHIVELREYVHFSIIRILDHQSVRAEMELFLGWANHKISPRIGKTHFSPSRDFLGSKTDARSLAVELDVSSLIW
jgi:hypothetical protein